LAATKELKLINLKKEKINDIIYYFSLRALKQMCIKEKKRLLEVKKCNV